MDTWIALPPPSVRAEYIETGRLLHALALRRAAAGLGHLLARGCGWPLRVARAASGSHSRARPCTVP